MGGESKTVGDLVADFGREAARAAAHLESAEDHLYRVRNAAERQAEIHSTILAKLSAGLLPPGQPLAPPSPADLAMVESRPLPPVVVAAEPQPCAKPEPEPRKKVWKD